MCNILSLRTREPIIVCLEMCILSKDIYDYPTVSQGKITIPHVDDGEEFRLTDVSANVVEKFNLPLSSSST